MRNLHTVHIGRDVPLVEQAISSNEHIRCQPYQTFRNCSLYLQQLKGPMQHTNHSHTFQPGIPDACHQH